MADHPLGPRDPDEPVTRIAHRGYALDAPENTIPAIERANSRADAIEIDVRACADDLVVIHDESVDRVTDASGPVSGFDAAELANLSVQGSEAGIPTLEDALAAVAPELVVQVEVKEFETVPEAVPMIANAECRGMVSSFDPAALRVARETNGEVPRSLIFDRDPLQAIETANELECVAVHPPIEYCRPDADGFRGPDLVARAHGHGLGVNAWTATTAEVVQALADVGVDGVSANSASVFPDTG